MKLDVSGLEVLETADCIELLGTQTLGRIALSSGALPLILPVNYVLVDDRIVIRTRRGTNLARATNNAVVAFEVDQIDVASGIGWSVVVQGFARELADPPVLAAVRAEPLARWLDPETSVHVEISLDIIAGRRLSGA